MGLSSACVNPSTLKPYIKSLKGGKDNSPEGLQVSQNPSYRAGHHHLVSCGL